MLPGFKQKSLLRALIFVFYFSCQTKNDKQAMYNTLDGTAPIVIAHRGASGLRPEHTLESYSLAIEQGADYIECDLVMTKDSVLICRHEPMLSGTTDVAERSEFATKKTTKMVDGIAYEDWFASDFTLAEIKTLKARQAFAERDQSYNGQFNIPTFEEVINLIKTQSARKGRTIGIYPETKHPTFHENLGLHLTDSLISFLEREGWNHEKAPVFIQSFEVSNLLYIRKVKKSTVKLVQLIDGSGVDKDGKILLEAPSGKPYDFVVSNDPRTYIDLVSDKGLDFINTYANAIGPWKPYIQPYTYEDKNDDGVPDDINYDGVVNDSDCSMLPSTDLVELAHRKGLLVHPFTFRNESRRLLKEYNNDPKNEYKNFYNLGVDGVFSDFTGTAVEARKEMWSP